MSIYFVQHGIALSKEIDPLRPLSTDGRKETEKVAAHLHKLGISVTKICHSGKTRAEETAQFFADQIGNGKITEISGMSPNDDVVAFSEYLEDETIYVGHLPHLGKLVPYLTVAGIIKTRHVK